MRACNIVTFFLSVLVDARMNSMVEAQDTSVIAQLGWADMRLPLLYSVSWPHRIRMSYKQVRSTHTLLVSRDSYLHL